MECRIRIGEFHFNAGMYLTFERPDAWTNVKLDAQVSPVYMRFKWVCDCTWPKYLEFEAIGVQLAHHCAVPTNDGDIVPVRWQCSHTELTDMISGGEIGRIVLDANNGKLNDLIIDLCIENCMCRTKKIKWEEIEAFTEKE